MQDCREKIPKERVVPETSTLLLTVSSLTREPLKWSTSLKRACGSFFPYSNARSAANLSFGSQEAMNTCFHILQQLQAILESDCNDICLITFGRRMCLVVCSWSLFHL